MRRLKQWAISLGVHGTVLAAILLWFAYPKPLASVAEEAITVDVVMPSEVPQLEPKPEPQRAEPETAQAAAASPPASAAVEQSAAPPPNRFDIAATFALYNIKVPPASFDAKSTQQANLTREDIVAFKKHLRSCWNRDGGVSAASSTHVILRIVLRADGALAAEPMMIEGSAAADGPSVMRTAIRAVETCAPFAFLPRERYDEWKTMDVRFSPREMAGG